jgi:hypothetical protein
VGYPSKRPCHLTLPDLFDNAQNRPIFLLLMWISATKVEEERTLFQMNSGRIFESVGATGIGVEMSLFLKWPIGRRLARSRFSSPDKELNI